MRPLLALAFVASACRPSAASAPVRVAAASDLATAFDDLSSEFERAGGARVEVILGSSGLLARQIAEGAPYDALLAADESFVERAIASGACDRRSEQRYARGRLVVWTRADAPAPAALEDLGAPRFARIAIANPDHAPYGRAAREALERAGLWARVERRIVRGDNVRATLQLARTGNADAALVAASLVVGDREGRQLVVDESLHRPLVQSAVACAGGRAAAEGRRFVAFVGSPSGQAILRRHGFDALRQERP